MRVHGPNNVYVLTTLPGSKSYRLERTLVLPPSTTLTSGAKVRLPSGGTICAAFAPQAAQLKADPDDLVDGVMVQLGNYSVIDHVDLDGNRTARHAVHGLGVLYPVIQNSIIHDTKNDYTSEIIVDQVPTRTPHLVFLDHCQGALVYKNIMRRAGCEPKLNQSQWMGISAAIYAPHNTDLRVDSNDIAQTLSAGVDFTKTFGAVITNNVIHETGLNATYALCTHDSCNGANDNTHGYIADGVTAYHNGHGETNQTISVTWNEIFQYHNHGIHLSGFDLDVEHNYVHDGAYNAIRIADQRLPPDCSSYFSIRYNTVGAGWPTIDGAFNRHEHQPILIANYKTGAVFDLIDNVFLDEWGPQIYAPTPDCSPCGTPCH